MPTTGPSPTIAKTIHKTKPKPVVDNSKSKSDENTKEPELSKERRALEEQRVCSEAKELVNGYIKNLNKEFKRGRQLYIQETARFRARERGLWGCVERGIAKRFFDNKTEHPDLVAFVKAIKADYKKWKESQPPEASEEQWQPYHFRLRRVETAKTGKTSGKRKAADTELASEDFVDEPEQYDDDVFNHDTNDAARDSESENDEDDEHGQCDDTAATAHASEHYEDEADVVDTTETYLAQPARRDNPKGKRSRFDKALKKSGGGGGGAFLHF